MGRNFLKFSLINTSSFSRLQESPVLQIMFSMKTVMSSDSTKSSLELKTQERVSTPSNRCGLRRTNVSTLTSLSPLADDAEASTPESGRADGVPTHAHNSDASCGHIKYVCTPRVQNRPCHFTFRGACSWPSKRLAPTCKHIRWILCATILVIGSDASSSFRHKYYTYIEFKSQGGRWAWRDPKQTDHYHTNNITVGYFKPIKFEMPNDSYYLQTGNKKPQKIDTEEAMKIEKDGTFTIAVKKSGMTLRRQTPQKFILITDAKKDQEPTDPALASAFDLPKVKDCMWVMINGWWIGVPSGSKRREVQRLAVVTEPKNLTTFTWERFQNVWIGFPTPELS